MTKKKLGQIGAAILIFQCFAGFGMIYGLSLTTDKKEVALIGIIFVVNFVQVVTGVPKVIRLLNSKDL